MLRQLREVLGSPNATLRMAVNKGKGIQTILFNPVSTVDVFIAGPIVTDNGNFVIDAPFGQEKMQDPSKVCPPLLLTCYHLH